MKFYQADEAWWSKGSYKVSQGSVGVWVLKMTLSFIGVSRRGFLGFARSAWRPRRLSKSVISRVTIGVTSFRVLIYPT